MATFLRKVASLADNLILEPQVSSTFPVTNECQPWSCYKSAIKRHKKLGEETHPLFSSLNVRNNVEEYIQSFMQKQCQMKLIKATQCPSQIVNVFRTLERPIGKGVWCGISTCLFCRKQFVCKRWKQNLVNLVHQKDGSKPTWSTGLSYSRFLGVKYKIAIQGKWFHLQVCQVIIIDVQIAVAVNFLQG